MVAQLEMFSGRAKKDYAREAQAAVTAPETAGEGEAQPTAVTNGAADEPEEALVAM